MPAFIIPLMAWIQAIMAAAPGVISIVKMCKDLISNLFSQNLVTKDQQDALHAWVDGIDAMVQAGYVPPSWVVRPDPPSPAP